MCNLLKAAAHARVYIYKHFHFIILTLAGARRANFPILKHFPVRRARIPIIFYIYFIRISAYITLSRPVGAIHSGEMARKCANRASKWPRSCDRSFRRDDSLRRARARAPNNRGKDKRLKRRRSRGGDFLAVFPREDKIWRTGRPLGDVLRGLWAISRSSRYHESALATSKTEGERETPHFALQRSASTSSARARAFYRLSQPFFIFLHLPTARTPGLTSIRTHTETFFPIRVAHKCTPVRMWECVWNGTPELNLCPPQNRRGFFSFLMWEVFLRDQERWYVI